MNIEATLKQRASHHCELCASTADLSVYEVTPRKDTELYSSALICSVCRERIAAPAAGDATQWYGLKESMWSEHPAVQVLVYRILKGLGDNAWAQDLLGQLYLDDEVQKWADAGLVHAEVTGSPTVVVDSNGTPLLEGDTVTLIKDLVVKGANFTAKRGTTVKNIRLTDDPKLIEGRVNGTHIVLVTAYLKKA